MHHTDYETLRQSLKGLIAGETNALANLANASALLYDILPNLNWAGFYLLRGDTLVLGPFQGKPACVHIGLGRGVCGAAAQRREVIVVPDVHAFPGHIACDGASRSEIVVPLVRDGQLLGVMDIDSPFPDRFSEDDRRGLEAFAAVLQDAIDWTQLVPRPPKAVPMRRKDRQEVDMQQILSVIERCEVVRIAFFAPEGPYIVPMNFCWEMAGEELILYMHCAQEGRKLDLLTACDRVGFEMDCSHALVPSRGADSYTFHYECVMGHGWLERVEDADEKSRMLSAFVRRLAGRELPIKADAVARTAVLKLRAEAFSCKRHLG